MSDRALPAKQAGRDGTVTYRNVRVVITPEAPYHCRVQVRKPGGDHAVHDVEHVVINTTEVVLDGPIWFVDVKLDVGVPIDEHGDTVWVWT